MESKIQNLISWFESEKLFREASSVDRIYKEAGKKEDLISQHPDLEAEITLMSQTIKPGFLNCAVNQIKQNVFGQV